MKISGKSSAPNPLPWNKCELRHTYDFQCLEDACVDYLRSQLTSAARETGCHWWTNPSRNKLRGATNH